MSFVNLARLSAISFVLAIGALPLRAEDMTVTVAAGKRSAIGTYGTYSTGGCTAGPVAQSRVATQAQHGRIEFVEERRIISAGQCGRVQANVVVVYYTPRKGYRGPDRASGDFSYDAFAESSRQIGNRVNFNITVK